MPKKKKKKKQYQREPAKKNPPTKVLSQRWRKKMMIGNASLHRVKDKRWDSFFFFLRAMSKMNHKNLFGFISFHPKKDISCAETMI